MVGGRLYYEMPLYHSGTETALPKKTRNCVNAYTYPTENNLLGITDANGHTANFTYGAFGRVTQTTFPSSFYESYDYAADQPPTNPCFPKSPFRESA
jgi:YD repeat-containing protein